ncbi:hypothetical protein PIROE2DRAFT_57774 [Piromyces sp. E2]|nr:hypothetical protein PIROE2DRAFT_57774 [Piromyces sp. E2]|eukprot:OUM68915.1 hypothetical protein PIROE2DRAFT_57774 [Piromyces sp. E2]
MSGRTDGYIYKHCNTTTTSSVANSKVALLFNNATNARPFEIDIKKVQIYFSMKKSASQAFVYTEPYVWSIFLCSSATEWNNVSTIQYGNYQPNFADGKLVAAGIGNGYDNTFNIDSGKIIVPASGILGFIVEPEDKTAGAQYDCECLVVYDNYW